MRSSSLGIRRRASRVAAVQALYQMEIAELPFEDALLDFEKRRLITSSDENEVITPLNVDEVLFREIVEGVTFGLDRFDAVVDGVLEKQRDIERIEVLLRLILRAGAYEILDRPDIDPPLSINEYVAVSQAFFGGTEPKLVNGVLDRIAKIKQPLENSKDGKG